jgi:hypothetical protein
MRPVRLLLVLAVLAASAPTQDKARTEYELRRTRALAECGQRHLQLGSWARDQGLVPQATAEFLLAVEVAEGKNPGAVQVLGIMRSLDQAFWTQRRKNPSRALLDAYGKRARAARRDDQAARFELARFAHAKKLAGEALRDFRALVGDVDEALEVDAKGRIVLDVGAVPADVSAQLLARAVKVQEQRYLPDDALAGLPDAATILQASSPELRVRGTVTAARILDLHALGTALLQELEQHVGGRPVHRVQVFVFGTRAEYAAYLAANALQRFRDATGFADYQALLAVVCAEGSDDGQLRGHFLHELAHLYDYQVAPAALPSWYREAFAESFGGPGAFRWQDGVLHLAAGIDGFPLRALLAADAGDLFAQDAARAHRFYLEAWGFFEYLRHGAGEELAARFAAWEAMCRGKALGAEPRTPGQRARPFDERAARQAFLDLFAADLDALEAGFVAWVKRAE